MPIGTSAATTAPKTSSSTISAAGRPICSSPFSRSCEASSLKSWSMVNSPVIAASNAGLSSAAVDLVEDVDDARLGVVAHRDGQQDGVLVLRDRGRVLRGVGVADGVRRPGVRPATERTSVTNSWNAGSSAVRVARVQDDELAGAVPLREALEHQVRGLLGLRVGRDVLVGRESRAEQRADRHDRRQQHHDPGGDHAPRMGRRDPGQALRNGHDRHLPSEAAAPSADDCNVIRFAPAVHGHTGVNCARRQRFAQVIRKRYAKAPTAWWQMSPARRHRACHPSWRNHACPFRPARRHRSRRTVRRPAQRPCRHRSAAAPSCTTARSSTAPSRRPPTAARRPAPATRYSSTGFTPGRHASTGRTLSPSQATDEPEAVRSIRSRAIRINRGPLRSRQRHQRTAQARPSSARGSEVSRAACDPRRRRGPRPRSTRRGSSSGPGLMK